MNTQAAVKHQTEAHLLEAAKASRCIDHLTPFLHTSPAPAARSLHFKVANRRSRV